MRDKIKAIVGLIYCFIFRINRKGKVLMGRRIKILGNKRVTLENKCTIISDNFICAQENATIRIGEGSRIQQYSRIAASNKIDIGSYVITGPNVFIADYNHEYRDINTPIKLQGNCSKDKDGNPNSVIIGDGSWIGTNSVVVGNVKIGKHVVIGANSVVNKDIPDYCVAVGMPAKVVKRYDFDKKEWVKV